MKIALILLIILFGIFILTQLFTIMSSKKIETQAYKVIKKEEKFEIRYYPSATLAMISSNSKSYRDLGSSGFSKLAKFIFGGNDENKQIAMTSPVHMDISDSISTMAFVLPSAYNQANLPKPNDSNISIITSEPEYVAAIQFGGFANTESINKYKNILESALKEKGLTYFGNFRFLGYNPPYQILNRKNEVIVSINKIEDAEK
jgi:SOUL heme-binding protein